MAVILVGMSDGSCPASSVCQNNPSVSTPNANSDLDLDGGTDANAAWAGIAVVIVVVVVGIAVWLGIRRRRRSRGGHNSVDAGACRARFTFPRFTFWRRSTPPQSPEQPISVEGEMELGGNEEPKSRRNSSASNLKRTTTAGTDIDPAAKLGAQHKEVGAGAGAGQYPMVPIHNAQLQSTETLTSSADPLTTHDASRNPRDSTSSSHRSSLSRLSIPPPGLGPPIHRPDSDLPSHAPSSSQPQNSS